MYGFVEGVSDTNDIRYCPKCGNKINTFYGDGTAECEDCEYRFGIVECIGEDEQRGGTK